MCCSMPQQTDVFKTLATEVAYFYRVYVEPGKMNSKAKRWVVGFEQWMENIKTWTERGAGGDGRFGHFRPFQKELEMVHFSTAFLYLMRFTFRRVSGNTNDVYHDEFVCSLKIDAQRCKAWYKVLDAMWNYLHAIEPRGLLENYYLNGEYFWIQQKLTLLKMGTLVFR